MLDNIEPLQNLLMRLSDVLPVSFVIDDMNEMHFSGQPEQDSPEFVASLKNFSTSVLISNTFKHQSNGFRYIFYGVPIRTQSIPNAVLVAYKDKERGGDDHQDVEKTKEVLVAVADIVTGWRTGQRESDEMAEQLSQSFEALSLYSRITPQIASLGLSEDVLSGLMEDLLKTIGLDLVFTRLPGREKFHLVVKGHEAPSAAHPDLFVDALVRAIPSDTSPLEDQYYIVNDSKSVPQYASLYPEPFRFLIAAIPLQHDTYGWLGLVSFNMKEIFHYSDLRLLTTVAKQMGITLTNMDLYAELEEFVINVVRSLVYTIEAKDVYTRGHSERVSGHCMKVADRLQLNSDERRVLCWASILHDMGKIGIPESVLNKPERLTDEEYGLVKMHPGKGYRILKSLKPLASSLPGILHHHERYDGKGYPEGLKGNEIPLHARIIAVADTFDAITSDRSYRSHKTPEEALTIINEVAGSQLDPDVVQVFTSVLRENVGLEVKGDLLDGMQGAD